MMTVRPAAARPAAPWPRRRPRACAPPAACRRGAPARSARLKARALRVARREVAVVVQAALAHGHHARAGGQLARARRAARRRAARRRVGAVLRWRTRLPWLRPGRSPARSSRGRCRWRSPFPRRRRARRATAPCGSSSISRWQWVSVSAMRSVSADGTTAVRSLRPLARSRAARLDAREQRRRRSTARRPREPVPLRLLEQQVGGRRAAGRGAAGSPRPCRA